MKKTSSSSNSAYHHGDLRTAILDAAEEKLAELPLSAISMRELARLAGVSPGAPFYHFGDREGLTSALCQRGFDRLDKMATATQDVDPLHDMVSSYIEFASLYPQLYQLMFSAEATAGELAAQLDPYASPIFERLHDEIGRMTKETDSKVLREKTTSVWCFMHGLVSLNLASPLHAKLEETNIEEFALTFILKLIEN